MDNNRNKGVTYVEILIAVIIIAYISLVFGQMFVTNNFLLVQTTNQSRAYNWAADTMEELKSMHYPQLQAGLWTDMSGNDKYLGENTQFTRYLNVIQVEPGLKEVEVIVGWDELGEDREVRIVSYVADYS